MKSYSEKELANFQKLLLNSEKSNEISEIKSDKWFSLDAFGTYNSDIIIGGRNCGESIFVKDEFNCAFKLQNTYSPTVDEENCKTIVYDVQQITVKIKRLECYGKWVDEVTSGYTFQAIIGSEELKPLNLPFNLTGEKWRLGENWIYLKSPNYIIAAMPEQMNDFDIVCF